ncbi:hypothetical protein BGX21_006368, partial [Mortierella sp. AD011]
NKPDELKAAIVADFESRGDPPIFCETSGNITVIVFQSPDENWYQAARALGCLWEVVPTNKTVHPDLSCRYQMDCNGDFDMGRLCVV